VLYTSLHYILNSIAALSTAEAPAFFTKLTIPASIHVLHAQPPSAQLFVVISLSRVLCEMSLLYWRFRHEFRHDVSQQTVTD